MNRITLLRDKRKKIIDDIFQNINKQLKIYLALLENPILDKLTAFKYLFKTFFENIQNKIFAENEFSTVYNFIDENFDYIINKHKYFYKTTNEHKNILKEAYELFKSSKF